MKTKTFYTKGLVYGCTLAMVMAMMTGCSDQSSRKTSSGVGADSTTSEVTSEAASDDRTYVQVTKVNGNTITADQGDWNGPDLSQKPEGKLPDEKKSDDSQGKDTASDQKPEGNPPDDDSSDNKRPKGNPPSQDQNGNSPKEHDEMGSPFTSNGESISLTITDNTKIVAQTRDGEEEKSLSDITTGSILAIESDDNGQTSKITIMPTMGGGPGGPDGQNGSGGGSSPSDDQQSSDTSS